MASPIGGGLPDSRPTFSGLATGLDTSALIQNLLLIEREPLNRLEARRNDVADQQDLMRDLNKKLLALRDAAREIDNRSFLGNSPASEEEFLSYKTESSDEDIVTARASNGATPGNLNVTVQVLAAVGGQFSGVFTSADTAEIAAGTTIRIELDGDLTEVPPNPTTIFEYTVGADGITLAALKALINSDVQNEDNITAEIVQVSDNEFRLVLTGKNEGVEADFTVSGNAISVDADLTQDATDAEFTISGLSLTRSSNTITDVLNGVTFELHGVSEPENLEEITANPALDTIYKKTSLEIDVDDEAIATTIKSFISKFNDVMTFINNQQKIDEATKRNGPLGNDSTLRTIKARLVNSVGRRFAFSAAPNNPFTSAASIGLKFGSGGRLNLDKDKLIEALERNTLAVRRLFSGSVAVDENGEPIQVPRRDDNGDILAGPLIDSFEEGLVTGIASLLKPVVRVGDGLLAIRDQGFVQRLKGFDDSIARFTRRLGKRQETLISQFTRLEQIVASFNAQSGFLLGLGGNR